MYPRILRRQLLVQFSVAAISSAVTFVKSIPFGWRRIMPPTAFLDGNTILLHEPVRKIFKVRCVVQHIRDLFRKISFAVSNFVCVGCCPAASRAAFSRSSFNWPRLRAQYSASLTRSFEPLSRSIWYSPAPSHNSMTSTRRCRMVWAVLECFMPSSQSRGFCI